MYTRKIMKTNINCVIPTLATINSSIKTAQEILVVGLLKG
jgi:hypothetical protein